MYKEGGEYSEQPTSARSLYYRAQVKLLEIEDRSHQRRGIKAQIGSENLLRDLLQEIAVMRTAIDDLRNQSFEQSQQMEERDRVDAKRFRENTFVSRIAACAGVIAVCIMIAQWLSNR